MPNQIVVAGALIAGSALLVAQRDRPPELAGLWELPGGKVAPGESDAAGLARELHEELGVEVTVGERLGEDVALNETMTLRAYRVTQTGGTLRPNDHRALRWVTADELAGLPWVPADRAWLGDLAQALDARLIRGFRADSASSTRLSSASGRPPRGSGTATGGGAARRSDARAPGDGSAGRTGGALRRGESQVVTC